MTMTHASVRKYEGFDFIDLKREPREVPSLDGMYRSFVAGPFVDLVAHRSGIRITVQDWPATKTKALVTGLRRLIDQAEGIVTLPDEALGSWRAFYGKVKRRAE